MDAERSGLSESERSELVAYLDRELDPSRAEAITDKLTRHPTVRREMETLSGTWELLDWLPRPGPSQGFSARTLSLATREAGHSGVECRRTSGLLRRAPGPLFLLALAASSVALGNLAIRWVLPDRTLELARELPIAEHLDAYRSVRDFEFLEQLERSGLFDVDDPPLPPEAAFQTDPPDDEVGL